MRFRKKPIEIEATQWFKNGDHPLDYSIEREGLENDEFRTWTGDEARVLAWEGEIVRYYRRPDNSGDRACEHCRVRMHDHGWIDTLEGGHIVCPGDWIITGVAGELYPCKPAIFAASYDAVVVVAGQRHADDDPVFAAFQRALRQGLSDQQIERASSAARVETQKWWGSFDFESALPAIVAAAFRAVDPDPVLSAFDHAFETLKGAAK